MLQKLLTLISSGKTHSLKQLAQDMNVSEALVDTMLDELVRRGYLQVVSQKCGGDCRHCMAISTCCISAAGRIWVLTEAGQQMAKMPA